MILVDTHVVVWLALEPGRLSREARAAIDIARKSGGGLAISDISLLELATLASKGRIDLHIIGILPAGSGGTVRCSSHQRPRLRARPGTSTALS